MLKISAVIITFNEEKNIRRCIESILDIAEEIIVIDSFSNDDTQRICKSFSQVNFIQKSWEGYSQTKNFGNSLAKNDLILSIDADEELSKDLIESIKQIKHSNLKGYYSFNRLTNYCGTWIKHCGWYPDTKTRIFENGKAFWEGSIHEELIFTDNLIPVWLNGDCYHYSYYTILEHKKQIEKYSTLLAEKLANKNEKVSFGKLVFSPIFRFFRDYFFKLGFLDGYHGLVICFLSSKATFLKYKKAQKLNQLKNG